MARVNLTEDALRKLKSAPAGKRRELRDAIVPGLTVRCTEQGKKTFMLRARFPLRLDRKTGQLGPWPGRLESTRVALGEVGALSLDGARDVARHWLELIGKGTDPRVEKERLRREQRLADACTFGAVAEDYIKRHLRGKRRARRDEQEIRYNLLPAWGDRLVTDITRRDVVELIEAIADRPALYTAHLVFGHARTMFNWAIHRGIYGLEASPLDRLRPGQLLGPKKHRERVLEDPELGALWRACDKIGYPHGPLVQLIALTGARRGEAAEAKWAEFDSSTWTVPSERFKSDTIHKVPLSPEAVALISGLPRFNGGPFMFTTTFGKKPVGDFSRAKERLDALMAEELGAAPLRWTLHDVRRTVRTRLSKLVTFMVAELIIGHAKSGLARVYDQHEYSEEKRTALAAWAKRLMSIVNPPPDNVVPMREAAK